MILACKCAGRGHAQKFCFRAMASCVNTPKPGVKYNQKRKAFGLPLSIPAFAAFHKLHACTVSGAGAAAFCSGASASPAAPRAALRCVCSSAAPPCQRQNVLRRVQQKIRRRAVLHAAQQLLGEALLHPPGDGPAQAARAGGRLVCLPHQQPRGGGRAPGGCPAARRALPAPAAAFPQWPQGPPAPTGRIPAPRPGGPAARG